MNASLSELLAQRERTHGNIRDNSEAFARLLEAVDLMKFPRELRYCLVGILVKLARMHSGRGDFVGHWEDVLGYAELGEQLCNASVKPQPVGVTVVGVKYCHNDACGARGVNTAGTCCPWCRSPDSLKPFPSVPQAHQATYRVNAQGE